MKETPYDQLVHIKRRLTVFHSALAGCKDDEETIKEDYSWVAYELKDAVEQVIFDLDHPDGVTSDFDFKNVIRAMNRVPFVFWNKGEACQCKVTNNDGLSKDPFVRGFVVPILTHKGFTFRVMNDEFVDLSPEEPRYFNTLGEAIEGGKSWFELIHAEQPLTPPQKTTV
jgi:hypothetical protein